MKTRVIAIIAFLGAGVLVFLLVINRQASTINSYNDFLSKARENANKEIPYIAVLNYQRALDVNPEDENIYKEYLEQCKLLEDDFYLTAVKNYPVKFPDSGNAYEELCNLYYDQEDYKKVLRTALEAREAGVATEHVKELFLECSVMYREISHGYNEATSFLGDYARVKTEEKYGYINANGYYLLLPQYDDASFFLGGFTAVNKDEEWYIMNETGYKVGRTSVPVDSLNFMNNDLVLFSLNGKYDYMSGELIVPDEVRFDNATNFRNGVAAVSQNGKWALLNSSNKFITEYIFEDIFRDEFNTCVSNGIIFGKQNGQYYMFDVKGNKVSPNGFDDVQAFASSEPAAVCINGKWGFVDSTGNIVIEPQYENARSFNVGLGGVCKEGKWGYIDANGTVRIDYLFKDCKPFSPFGVTAVVKDEEEAWTYIKLYSYIN